MPCERVDPKTNDEGAVTCRQVRAQAVKVQPYGDVNGTRTALLPLFFSFSTNVIHV